MAAPADRAAPGAVRGPDAEEERLYFAPIDVSIDVFNVLIPDVLILDEPMKGDEEEVRLPLLVIEVLSPTTAKRDRQVKTDIYLEAGVQEGWLVDHAAGVIETRSAEETTEFRGAKAVSAVVEGLELNLRELFCD